MGESDLPLLPSQTRRLLFVRSLNIVVHSSGLKDNFRILQLKTYFPICLCQSDEWKLQFLKLCKKYSGRVQPLTTAT